MSSVLLALLPALAGAAIAYLVARSRTAAERADLRVAQERYRQARAEADGLRSERDKAHERVSGLEREHSKAQTELKTLTEQVTRLQAALEAGQERLQRAEAEAERLKASLETERQRLDERDRLLQEAEKKIAALAAREDKAREEVQELREQLSELTAQKQGLQEQAARLEAARKELDRIRERNNKLLEETLRATAADMLQKSRTELVAEAEERLAAVSKPVKEQLALLDRQLQEFSTSRAAAEAKLDQQLATLAEEGARTREETRKLVEALKKPQVRGRWGEMQLKRAVELAGLVEHCDFDSQVHLTGDDNAQRPDLVIHLSNGRHVVVDAKVPMTAFIAAIEASDDAEADKHWADHARQLRQHVDDLASKEYHRRVGASPEFVVLFVPSDAFLVPALEHDPALQEYAATKRVMIVTPTILIAMLRTIAYAWTQAALEENLKQVYDIGRELYERLSKLGEHFERLGKALNQSVKAYNDTVGSLERRVLVTARKFHSLKLTETQLKRLDPIEQAPRPLGAPELTGPAADEASGVTPAPAGGPETIG